MRNYKVLFIVLIVVFYLFVFSLEAKEPTMDVDYFLKGENYTCKNYFGRFLFVTFIKKGYGLEKRPEQQPELLQSGAPPYEMDVKCYLVKGKKIIKKIDSLNDLKGFVQIDSAGKAIEFVRLRTSEHTYFLFRPEIMIEVFDRDGEKTKEQLRLGGVSHAFMKENKIKNMHVVNRGEYYEITRFLLNYSWPGAKEYPSSPSLFQVLEKVYSDGRYYMEKTLHLSGVNYKDIPYPLHPK